MEIAFQCKQYFDVCHRIRMCLARAASATTIALPSLFQPLLLLLLLAMLSFCSYLIFVTCTEFRRKPLISKGM